ncbi:MAG: hypothetical protein WB460_15035, partial [Candidatus Acidiferrales bacterium]
TEPLQLPHGESRRYLEDGDEVIFKARAKREGYVPVGFGECRARVGSPDEYALGSHQSQDLRLRG